MADSPPNSFKDPYWTNLAGGVEDKLGLPKGLLVSVVNRGERTNADQVSEAGARTPFQIIPATRKAAIDKYGIDPYLSPQNAAEVAGRLMQDSLKRNNDDPALAVAEYHGGTDRANWGPRTKAYVSRVMEGVTADPAQLPDTGAMPDTSQPMAPGTSTFDRLSASMGKPSESQIANVFKAYQSGQMPAADAQQFEADVKAGHIMLPRGAALNAPPAGDPNATPGAAAPASNGVMLPDAVVQAYTSGRMPVDERIALEQDVKSGAVQMPAGVEVHDTKAPGFLERMQEQITGAQRATPQTQALPDWAGMPELNSASMASFKAALGTMATGPQETVQILKANFPGVQVEQDEKGNYLLTSSIDGKQYAIKPGFQVSDIPRAGGMLAAFTPAGRAESMVGLALKSGATQAGIEGTQAATGGNFDPGEVATAALLAPVVPLGIRAAGSAIDAASPLLARLRGAPAPAAAAREAAMGVPPAGAGAPVPETAPVVPETVPVAPPAAPVVPPAAAPVAEAVAPAATLSATDLAQTARKAAEGGMGSKDAAKTLAEAAAPDAKTVDAAKRLGIEDYLQPDHVTTNQAYRELAQAVKSIPGSEARAGELQGLEKVGERANKLIEDIGGTTDASQISHDVQQAQFKRIDDLGAQESRLYGQVRAGVPPRTPAPADNALAFVEQRAKDLGGPENLSPMEKTVLQRLSPKPDGTPPTYTLLDDVRKDVGAVTARGGPFADADVGLAKQIYGRLAQDQLRVAESTGQKWNYLAAQYATKLRKGVEDDMTSLFGKEIDKSLAPAMTGAIRALPQGDASKLVKLLAAVPQQMRQEVAAAGVATAFRTAGTRGPISFGVYEKWFDGLLRNKQAHAALMTNLPPAARKQLSDLYRVSKGISAASRERITTGRIQAVQEQFKAADGLAGKLYAAAKRGAVGAAAGTVATPILGPGVGAAIASALTKGAKPAADKAVDTLIASPEFLAAARAAGTPSQAATVRSLAYSKAFTKFVRAVGQPRDLSDRERWILGAMQTTNNLNRGPHDARH